MINREIIAIEVDDLSYSYPDGTLALDEVNFSLKRGESMALLGPNGAGKSTLLLHLNGLLRGGGEVRIWNKEVCKENLRWVRGQVGMVFQDPDDQLFMSTLAEDVAFGPANMGLPEDQVRERVVWALQSVGLAGLSGKVPHHLSFGQRKRAAFATVLSMKPSIMVLDEPTSNLDPQSKMEMVYLIREQQRNGAAIVTATHDVNLVALLADRVLLLDKRVVAEGTVSEIMSQRDLMDELGLEMPIIADLFQSMKEEGLYSGAIPFGKYEAMQAIRAMLRM
jgi:cobalt/nickel transport system ATP-binding protein